MPFKLSVLNKQRRQTVNVSAVRRMGEKIFAAACSNLLTSPSAQMPEDVLQELQERGSLSLVLVSNQQIRKLNSQWMGKDSPTDVLSFPLGTEPPPAALPFEVGELVISLDRAKEQAEEFGHSFERELAFLFAHGTLHILGFDHMSAADEKEMFGRQKAILDAAGYKR